MYRKSEYVENFKFIECTNSSTSTRKLCTLDVQMVYEYSMENCADKIYETSEFGEKFKFVKCMKSWKFNGILCTLDVQIIQIHEKFKFVNYTISWKFRRKLCTLDEKKKSIFGKKIKFVEYKPPKLNRKVSTLDGKIWIHWMYDILKIRRKFMYSRCTKSLDSWKNSNLLNIWYRENSMKNWEH